MAVIDCIRGLPMFTVTASCLFSRHGGSRYWWYPGYSATNQPIVKSFIYGSCLEWWQAYLLCSHDFPRFCTGVLAAAVEIVVPQR